MKAGTQAINVNSSNPVTLYDPSTDGMCSAVRIKNDGANTLYVRESLLHGNGNDWLPLASGEVVNLAASPRNIGLVQAYGTNTAANLAKVAL